MPTFTFEETELLCICDGETREEYISFLDRMRMYLPADEPEVKALINTVIEKLSQMTDAQFDVLKPTLISNFDELEE